MSFGPLIEQLKEQQELSVQLVDDHSVEIKTLEKTLLVSTNPNETEAWLVDINWLNKAEILASKIINKLGLSQRIHARKCEVKRIDKPTMEAFLEMHHLNGKAGAKHKFGLFLNEQLVALVSFAAPRIIQGKRSAELVRYCVLSNHSIPGGLDKLIQHYIKEYPCDDIFTYVDLKWSSGNGFKNIGFVEEGVKVINDQRMLKLRLIIDKSSSHQHS